MYVYLEMGSNRLWVVGILIPDIFYLFVYEKLKQIDKKKKVGDPKSWLVGIDYCLISLCNLIRFDAVFFIARVLTT